MHKPVGVIYRKPVEKKKLDEIKKIREIEEKRNHDLKM
jgi:hypothetical protein